MKDVSWMLERCLIMIFFVHAPEEPFAYKLIQKSFKMEWHKNGTVTIVSLIFVYSIGAPKRPPQGAFYNPEVEGSNPSPATICRRSSVG